MRSIAPLAHGAPMRGPRGVRYHGPSRCPNPVCGP